MLKPNRCCFDIWSITFTFIAKTYFSALNVLNEGRFAWSVCIYDITKEYYWISVIPISNIEYQFKAILVLIGFCSSDYGSLCEEVYQTHQLSTKLMSKIATWTVLDPGEFGPPYLLGIFPGYANIEEDVRFDILLIATEIILVNSYLSV